MKEIEILLEQILTFIWENITFEMFAKFVLIYILVVWFSLIIWVIRDIANRTHSILGQVCSILVMIVPFGPFGIFLYLIFRPRTTLYDKYYGEIEENLEIFAKIMQQTVSEKKKKKQKKENKKNS